MKLDLKKTLDQYHFSPSLFAKLTGFHTQTIKSWIYGYRNMKKDSQEKIIKFLKKHNYDIYWKE